MNPLTRFEGMAEVEARLKESLQSQASALTEISNHLVQLGGKRIRPLLCLLSAKALGMKTPSREIICAATGIELIHSATLLHDDIIDKSPIRRKEVSAYRKYGLAGTLLAGDFLLVRAFGLCAELDDYVVKATEEACVELTEGEILETPLNETNHNTDSALLIARKKTASLFRLAAECAAHLCGRNIETKALMRSFGENLGIAFQILDDILDVAGDPKTVGKAAGIDIRERKPSLVNMLWLEGKSPLSSRLCSSPSADSENSFVEEALVEIRSSGVLSRATSIAQNYAQDARGALQRALALNAEVVDRNAESELIEIITFVIQRLN